MEAANLRQNSQWFAKFQWMEGEIGAIKQRLDHCESRRGEFPTALNNTREQLEASIDELSKACAASNQQLQNSIEAQYKKCGE